MLGKNKKGEPAFLVRVGNLENGNFRMEDLATLTFYLCEKALKLLKPPQLTVVAILDFKGFHNWATFYSSELKDKILTPLVMVYPELLGKGYVINTPLLFEGLFRVCAIQNYDLNFFFINEKKKNKIPHKIADCQTFFATCYNFETLSGWEKLS